MPNNVAGRRDTKQIHARNLCRRVKLFLVSGTPCISRNKQGHGFSEVGRVSRMSVRCGADSRNLPLLSAAAETVRITNRRKRIGFLSMTMRINLCVISIELREFSMPTIPRV